MSYCTRTAAAALVATLCGFASESRAQETQETSALLVEVDALVGRTAVDVAKWGRANRVENRSQRSAGVNARLFISFLGKARVGFELGSQHLFTYEVLTQTGTSLTRERHTVAAQHASVIARFAKSPKLTLDAGAGFYYFSETSLPGLLFEANYVVLQGKKLAIPVGVRMDLIVDNEVSAIPVSLKAGVSFKP